MTAPNSPLWTAEEAAAATDGVLAQGDGARWTAQDVCIDSRTVRPGDLFIALTGERTDGHRFVDAALAAGAAAAIVSRPVPGLGRDAPLLSVSDTVEALVGLGCFARLRSSARIAAVTGSVGKTGTKDALRQVLSDQGPTTATVGNLNNHLGVPLSLARLPADSRFGVFEVGMNHAGEIAPLSTWIKPHVAIISTVDAVHLEFFPSVEAIADEKAEIFRGMGPSGVAVLPRDNPHFPRLLAHARTQGLTNVLSFGSDAACDARLVSCVSTATGSAVEADILGTLRRYHLPVAGRHWVMNTLGVLLAAHSLGADIEQAVETLERLSAPKGRGSREMISLPGGGAVELIDESYNASPVAVAAALKVLGDQTPAPGGRRIVVLGDMLELGDTAPQLHRNLLPAIRDCNPDRIFLAGAMTAHLAEALADETPALRNAAGSIVHAADSRALAPMVADCVRAGDIIMVKGSLGSRMSLVIEALRQLEPSGSTGNGGR